MFVVVTRSTVVALLLCFALSWRIAESSNAKGAGSAGSGLFAHERAMAEAKSILQMLGVKNPSEAQLQEMTETVKTTGLTLEDLKQAQESGLKDGEMPNEEHLRAGGFEPIEDVDLEAMERELNEL